MSLLQAALLTLLGTAPPGGTAMPAEAWRYNAGERTRAGLSALAANEVDGAVERFAAAARLAPDNPLTGFNHGTARLIAADPEAAAALETVLTKVPPELKPHAFYNLGNARLAGDDATAAIEAYEEALRADPSFEDAKFNLELALKRLAQQQQNERQGSGSDDQESTEPSQEPPSDSSQKPDKEASEGEETSPEAQSEDAPDKRSQQEPGSEPLPGFEQQPEMTAEQAAAILEAVEDLERDHRRRQAAERARRHSGAGKDW